MRQVLEMFPGAQRALFRRYHIGGCSSCGFQPSETLGALCARNGNLDVQEVLAHIQASHALDERILIAPMEAAKWLAQDRTAKLVDIRSREEFEAAAIPGAVLLTQDLMQEALARWPRQGLFIVVDHQGRQSLDAAAYFLGHGFENMRALRGGIDAWSLDVDAGVPRYRLG
jgi:rhodanese-related sulfurtransferase